MGKILASIPKDKITAFLTLILGIILISVASVGTIDYGSLHFILIGPWRIVIIVLGAIVLGLGAWLLLRETEDVSGQSIRVDLTSFPGISKKKKTLHSPAQITVDAFLDKIYLEALVGVVQRQTYGREWILVDGRSGRQFRNLGADWARSRGMAADNRSLIEAGIYAGMKVRVENTKGGLVIDATPFRGGDQPPAVYGWGTLTTAGNLLRRICRDLLPDEAPQGYGKRWVLTAVDGSDLAIQPEDARPLTALGIHDNTRLDIRRPLVAGHAEEPLIELMDVPEILRQPLLVRRNQLNENMSQLLEYIRQETRSGDYLQLERIARRFPDLAQRPGMFYRLQVLYLMGFIDRRSAGRDEHGEEHHAYALSPAFRQQIPHEMWGTGPA
jgi:hypothetical protein